MFCSRGPDAPPDADRTHKKETARKVLKPSAPYAITYWGNAGNAPGFLSYQPSPVPMVDRLMGQVACVWSAGYFTNWT